MFLELMKLPKSKLVSKCIALEELLSKYYQLESIYYDLQNRYDILLLKSQGDYSKLNCPISEKIEIYELQDVETNQLIQQLQLQNSKMSQQLKQSRLECQELHNKVEESINIDQQNGFIVTLKAEIARLNSIVTTLRIELSKYKTRDYEIEWEQNKNHYLDRSFILESI